MRITLQLTPEAATRARALRTRSAAGGVLPWLTQQLEPVHPATSDPALATFFTVDVGGPQEAAQLVKRLCEDPCVEGAYIKPDDEIA